MNQEPDFYGVLGVSPTSEDVVIQAAYRALMRRYHPDTNPSPQAAERAVEINRAYTVLGDAERRAAYDENRGGKAHHAETTDSGPFTAGSSSAPPDSPPPNQSDGASHFDEGEARTKSRSAEAIAVYALLVLGSGSIAIFAAMKSADNFGGSGTQTIMNVDENLTTDMGSSDFNADDIGSSTDMNSIDANMTMESPSGLDANATSEQTVVDLSRQTQGAVSYSVIESAAQRFTTILRSQGIAGARSYSERCHQGVDSVPTWDGADRCAAFDYAAAYIDLSVSRSSGLTQNGYFQFQRDNQAENYASVGAPSYITHSRLSQISRAAEKSAGDALRAAIAEEKTSSVRQGTVPARPEQLPESNSEQEAPQ